MQYASTDIRYRDTPGGSNQSGSSGRSCSPARVKPRTGPPSTPIKGDLRDLLTGRQRQTSQAQSQESKSWDRGGKGHSGSHQSPRPYKRTNQGPSLSSSSMGPPRPPPSATATSGALEASEPGHHGHRKRQPDEQDRSVTKKVSYYYCCSFKTLMFVNLSQTQIWVK